MAVPPHETKRELLLMMPITNQTRSVIITI